MKKKLILLLVVSGLVMNLQAETGNPAGGPTSVMVVSPGEENLIFDTLQSPDKPVPGEILFTEGTYFMEETLVLRGSEHFSGGVTFSPVGEAEVTIYGGFPVTDWEPDESASADLPVFRAFVGRDRVIRNVLEDGSAAIEAAWPDDGYMYVGRRASDDKQQFYPDPEDALHVYKGAYLKIWPGQAHWNWMTLHTEISDFESETGLATTGIPTRYLFDHGARYRLSGRKEYISRPGEFYYDSESGFLFYAPYKGSPEGRLIVASEDPVLFDIQGTADHPVSDIHFRNLNLMLSGIPAELDMADYGSDNERLGMIRFRGASDSSVEKCRIAHAGLSAVLLDREAENIRVSDCVIEEAGYNGIFALGYPLGEGEFASTADSYVNRNNRFENNRILRSGRFAGHASGVQLYQSGGNLISRNTIQGSPRYGISFKGINYWNNGPLSTGKVIYGETVTDENRHGFLHTRENIVEYNDISRCMTDSQDGGLFEAWGSGRDNTLRYNWFHDAESPFREGLLMGIYLDDASDCYILEKNMVTGLRGDFVFPVYAKGVGHRIINNVFYGNESEAGIAFWAMMGVPNNRITLEKNIFHQAGVHEIYRFYDWTEDKISAADSNIYWHPGGRYRLKGIPGSDRWRRWRKLYDSRFDAGSLLEDPLFTDPEGGNFSFREGSPAPGLGIEPLNTTETGNRP